MASRMIWLHFRAALSGLGSTPCQPGGKPLWVRMTALAGALKPWRILRSSRLVLLAQRGFAGTNEPMTRARDRGSTACFGVDSDSHAFSTGRPAARSGRRWWGRGKAVRAGSIRPFHRVGGSLLSDESALSGSRDGESLQRHVSGYLRAFEKVLWCFGLHAWGIPCVVICRQWLRHGRSGVW